MKLKYTTYLLIILGSLGIPFSYAWSGNPRCFMHGIMIPRYEKKESNMENMLRLNFDGETKGKCEDMMRAYCEAHVKGQSYSPEKLKGSFKLDADKSEETSYEFTENCKLKPTDTK